MKKLKCLEHNLGYYNVGEEFPIIKSVCRYVTIEVNKSWTYNELKPVDILLAECIDKENNIYQSDNGKWQIIEE